MEQAASANGVKYIIVILVRSVTLPEMAELTILLLLYVAPPVSAQTDTGGSVTDIPSPVKFDILAKHPEPECPEQTADEIVVCGEQTDQERYRLRRTDQGASYEEEPNKAEFAISENTKIAAENEAAQIGPGVQSNRLMARIKIKF